MDQRRTEFGLELSPGAASQWEAFWSGCRFSHPEQHPRYADVVQAQGRMPVFVSSRRDDVLTATAILSLKPHFGRTRGSLEALCARGPVFDRVEDGATILAEIIQWCKDRFIGSVYIQPNWAYPEAEPLEAALRRLGFVVAARQRFEREHTGIIRLDASEEQLLAGLSQGTRSHLRRAQRWGATVRSAQSHEEVALFIGRYSQMSQDRDLSADSPTVLQTKYEKLTQPAQLGTLLLAFLDGRFVGGLMLVRGSTIAYAHRYVVVPELLRNLRIGPLLWWKGLQWAKRQGSVFFDVSGYREDADASSAMYEVYRFKAGFKPTVIDKLSNYRYVCYPTLRHASRARNLLERGLHSAGRAARQLRGAFAGKSGQRETSRTAVGEE